MCSNMFHAIVRGTCCCRSNDFEMSCICNVHWKGTSEVLVECDRTNQPTSHMKITSSCPGCVTMFCAPCWNSLIFRWFCCKSLNMWRHEAHPNLLRAFGIYRIFYFRLAVWRWLEYFRCGYQRFQGQEKGRRRSRADNDALKEYSMPSRNSLGETDKSKHHYQETIRKFQVLGSRTSDYLQDIGNR